MTQELDLTPEAIPELDWKQGEIQERLLNSEAKAELQLMPDSKRFIDEELLQKSGAQIQEPPSILATPGLFGLYPIIRNSLSCT